MGCPARKVAATGCGAALTRAPALAREIIRAVKRGIQDWYEGRTLNDAGLGDDIIEEIKLANRRRSGHETPPRQRRLIPVSVKTRLGYDRNVIDEWLPTLLEESLAAISLHGRTLEQGYKGEADWDAIGRAVEIAKGSRTLILGNGDVHDLRDAYRRVRETRVDGVLIGRAAQGNPWLFRDKESVKQALRTNALLIDSTPVGLAERFQVIMEHSEHFENFCDPSRFMAMRKHLTWYCRNFRGAAEMRAHMTRVNSAEEVRQCLMKYVALIDDELNSAKTIFHNRESTLTASSSYSQGTGFTS
jgi:tRNA-dihydrouridine synthase